MLHTASSLLLLTCFQLMGQVVQITSPANGTGFAPGDTISVAVSVQGSVRSVVVLGPQIGVSTLVNTPPYVFSMIAPKQIVGPQTITAVGFTGPGVGVFSAQIVVDVESNASLVALKPSWGSFQFRYITQQIPISVVGTFSDGSFADVTRSSRVAYA